MLLDMLIDGITPPAKRIIPFVLILFGAILIGMADAIFDSHFEDADFGASYHEVTGSYSGRFEPALKLLNESEQEKKRRIALEDIDRTI